MITHKLFYCKFIRVNLDNLGFVLNVHKKGIRGEKTKGNFKLVQYSRYVGTNLIIQKNSIFFGFISQSMTLIQFVFPSLFYRLSIHVHLRFKLKAWSPSLQLTNHARIQS